MAEIEGLGELQASIEELTAELEGLRGLQSVIQELTSTLKNTQRAERAAPSKEPTPKTESTPTKESTTPKESNSKITTLETRLEKQLDSARTAYQGVTDELRRTERSLKFLEKQQTYTRRAMAQIDVPILNSIINFRLIAPRQKLQLAVMDKQIQQAQADVAVKNVEFQKVQQQVRESEYQIRNESDILEKKKNLLQEELSAITKNIKEKQLERRGISELIGIKKEEGDSTRSRIAVAQQELTAKESTIQALNDSNKSLKDEQDALLSVVGQLNKRAASGETLTDAENAQREQLQSRIMEIIDSIKNNNAQLDKERLSRFDLVGSITTMQSEVDKLVAEQKDLEREYQTLTHQIQELTVKGGVVATQLTEAKKREQELNEAREENKRKLEESSQALQDSNVKVRELTEMYEKERLQQRMEKLAGFNKVLTTVATEFTKLEKIVRETQQKFGIAAGAAAQLAISQRLAALKSMFTPGPQVSAEEISGTQQAFQTEFGGVISTAAATDLAKQAKEMGVGAADLAKARRVFMTQTMGDVGQAKAQTDKFIAEFQKKGLTSKDAMAAISQNSELLARNGTRFATSFARAAADAKKIGVDLSKIDQVGDNIIGNFEGFLESQAELGAMGFGFDSSKLAEVAETGDTGALMNELRSQLASTGKDITKLRRSEQLALSQAFGLSMEDLQRMGAPGEKGAGESMEDLQKSSNSTMGKILEAITNGLGKVAGILGIVSGVIQGIQTLTLLQIAANTGGLGRLGGVFNTVKGFFSKGKTATVAAETVGATSRAVGTATTAAKTAGTASRVAGVATEAATAGRVASTATEAAGAVGTVSKLSKFGSLAKFGGKAFKMGGRLLGKAALPLSIAMSAYDAYRGFTADKDATLGQKLKNAGSSALSGLTLGLLGKDASEIAASTQTKPTVIPSSTAATPQLPTTTAQLTSTLGITPAVTTTTIAGTSMAPTTQQPVVNVDFTRLENKLDQVIRAIGSMEVNMDGNKVGKVLVNNNDAATTVGVFRQGARATL